MYNHEITESNLLYKDGTHLVLWELTAAILTEVPTSGITGISYNNSSFTVHFNSEPLQEHLTAVEAAIAIFDPVFISAVREGGIITVLLDKPNNVSRATELTLTVDGTAVPTPTSLTNNQATVILESLDTITLGIEEDYAHAEVYIT